MGILEILASRGPLKITHIMQKANVNCNVVKDYLDFLIGQGAVEKRFVGKERIVFATTKRGLDLIRYFEDLKQVIPTVKTRIEIPSNKTKKEAIRN